MPLWERRTKRRWSWRAAVFHLLLISIQVPRGAGKSLFERAVFFVFSPVQRAAFSARSAASDRSGTDYFDLRGVRAENQKLKKEIFFLNQDVRFLEDRLALDRSEAELRASLAEFRGSLVAARVIGVDSANSYQPSSSTRAASTGRPGHGRLRPRRHARRPDHRPISLKEVMVQLITDKDSSVSVMSVIIRPDRGDDRPVDRASASCATSWPAPREGRPRRS